MEMERLKIMLFLLVIGLTFLPAYQCVGETRSDLQAIRELFLNFERGYEERDLEKYMSVFSDEEYEYIGDMATPDDPSDDVHILRTEKERRSAERVFNRGYEILDLELTEPEIAIDGNTAEAKNDIMIVFSAPGKPIFPRILYAASSNTYSMKKLKGKWKIVRWEQRESPSDELEARRQKEIEDRGVESLIEDLGSDSAATWAMAVSDLRKVGETNVAPIAQALNHPDRNVRYRAIWVLAGIKDYDALEALANILKNEEEDADIRYAAIKALFDPKARINPGHPAVDNALLVAARSGDSELKNAAYLALALRFGWRMDRFPEYAVQAGWSGDEIETTREEMIKSLIEAFGSSDINLRRQTAISLGHLGHQPALEPLTKVLLDKDEDVSVRTFVVESIFQIDQDKAFGSFSQIMKDKNEKASLREMAAYKLARFRDDRSVPLFLNVLKDKEEPLRLRQTAIKHLRSVRHLESVHKDESYIAALEIAADDEDEQIAGIAREMLNEIK
jgi:HEAT repeat protein